MKGRTLTESLGGFVNWDVILDKRDKEVKEKKSGSWSNGKGNYDESRWDVDITKFL